MDSASYISCDKGFRFVRLLTLFVMWIAGIAMPAFAQIQEYGNEWYQPSQRYVKFSVNSEGIYRVYLSDLLPVNWDTLGADPSHYQLFFRGEQQHIHVETTPWGQVDFLEFYGRKNDGKLDSTMYRSILGKHPVDPSLMPHPYYSLFTDTAAYFLTVGQTPGLRMSSFQSTNYSSFTPESFFRHEAIMEMYSLGFHYGGGGGNANQDFELNSNYGPGEGYGGLPFRNMAPNTIYFPLYFPYPNASPAEFETSVNTLSPENDYNNILVSIHNGVSLIPSVYTTITGIGFHQLSGTFNMGTNFYSVPIEFSNVPIPNGTIAPGTGDCIVRWAKVKYDRQFNLAGERQVMMSRWNKPTDAFFKFQNAFVSGECWAWDLTTHTRSIGSTSYDTVKVIVPGASIPRNIFVVNNMGLKSPVIEDGDIFLNNISNVNGGGELIIITNSHLLASAQAYKEYRDTNSVNRLQTKIVLVEEIWDEFGWGSETPVAIKRFCKWAIDEWVLKPKFVLLWGKPNVRNEFRTGQPDKNAVCTWGVPASDYDFVSNFENDSMAIAPVIPIGRISILTNADGLNYLEKVDEYEHSPWENWMKEGLFLGGGKNLAENDQIWSGVTQFIESYVAAPWAGKEWHFQHRATGAISNLDDAVEKYISRGLNLICLYGHSSSTVLEIDFRSPENYLNWGKYPMVVALGCYGGNFLDISNTTTSYILAETHIAAKRRGSIGYLANSTLGLPVPMTKYGKALMESLYNTDSVMSIGGHIKAAMKNVQSNTTTYADINHARQLNLLGDPSVRLYNPLKPDIEANQEAGMQILPTSFIASDSAFSVQFLIENHGLAVKDSLSVQIIQTTPSSGQIIHPVFKIPGFLSQDTLTFALKNAIGNPIAGLNTFDVTLDYVETIDEYNETNNTAQYQIFIPGQLPTILSPPLFAIVDSNKVELRAASFLKEHSGSIPYLFEIDTVFEFNSAALQVSPTVFSSSFLAKWEPPFSLEDGKVYFWRVRLRDVLPAQWANASFTYEQGKTGWSQSEVPQFFANPMTEVEIDSLRRLWMFGKTVSPLFAKSVYGSVGYYRLDNGRFASRPEPYTPPGVGMVSIDQYTLNPYFLQIPGYQLGDWLVTQMPDNPNPILQQIYSTKPGDYFLMVNTRNAKIPQWSPLIFQALQQVGATGKLDSLPDGAPFIFLGRKGYYNQAREIVAPNAIDSTTGSSMYILNQLFQSFKEKGEMQSPHIGPAYQWKEVNWSWSSLDQELKDKARLKVKGVRPDGKSDSLFTVLSTQGAFNLAGLNADRFPYLILEVELIDSSYRTPPQMNHWKVYFEGVPDAVVDPIFNVTLTPDSIPEGMNGSFGFNLYNSSDYSFRDSLYLAYYMERSDRKRTDTTLIRILAPPANDSVRVQFDFSTKNKDLEGISKLYCIVNPDLIQPELYYHNNFINASFYLKTDKINPILDVTFDGKHIMNNDLLQPNPEIQIQLIDENPYLRLADTAFVIRFGKGLASSNLPRVFIDGNPNMEKVPILGSSNKTKLLFRPGPLANGIYTLTVQGYDSKENPSGKNDYEISFEVVNESTLSQVLNYPNPFSTCTHFVYSLTGSKQPDVFKIYIYTITGKLIKVVDMLTESQINIGYNVSDYCWDGKDEFGDLLANGVYLYRVDCRFGKKKAELRDEGISDFFNQDYGKMYLLR